MAEVLVFNELALSEAARVVVWNEAVKKRVRQFAAKAGKPLPPVDFQLPGRYHYFTPFFREGEEGRSLVTGPRGIAHAYRCACQEVAQKIGQNQEAPFGTPKKLLEALRESLGTLPHTAELIGLRSENGVHKHTVDVHTQDVVKKLRALPEFAKLPPELQDRVELAAFLHDIGKGPKSRWVSNDGLQKVDPDHPVRAMPMMVEILTHHVKKVNLKNAELILKLVCYHDLVGEVLGKGRDERQIVDVAKSELELNMLFVLGKADSTSLVEEWWDDGEAAALYERCRKALEVSGSEPGCGDD